MRYYIIFCLSLLLACTSDNKPTEQAPDFDTSSLKNLFGTDKVTADYFSMGTDRGRMLNIEVNNSPGINKDSIDIENSISTAAYLSYLQLKEEKKEAEKIRISVYKKVVGNTDKYTKNYPIDTLELVNNYYTTFHERLSMLKERKYQGVIDLLDKKMIADADTLFTSLHDTLFETYGPIKSITFAGFNFGEQADIKYMGITGDYFFEDLSVPFVYTFRLDKIQIIGFFFMDE